MAVGDKLIANLHKLHTTALGVMRIKMNLSLRDEDDAVLFCKNIIQNIDTNITREGKNWYALTKEYRITVNAYSYTIITAHKIKMQRRRDDNKG